LNEGLTSCALLHEEASETWAFGSSGEVELIIHPKQKWRADFFAERIAESLPT
jgi:hypothetical protein